MIPFCGPSYTLSTRKAEIQRSVNLYLLQMEAAAKSPYILQSVPGLTLAFTLNGECRGALETNRRAFIVSGSTLYEIFADGTSTVRGVLNSSSGPVSMAYGVTQLVMVDGESAYALTLSTNTFQRVTAEAYSGADTVSFIDNYFLLTRDRHGQQFQLTAINDILTIDALDFASAESAPDDIVSHLVVQAGALIFGTRTTELFVNTGAADFPLERSRGSGFRVGLLAAHSLCEIDNGCVWLGRDNQGSGIVYKLSGGQAQRVSTQAVEQSLKTSTDLKKAVAFAYQDRGVTFYCLQAPGVPTTWCFEVSTSQWHERTDIGEAGQYKAWRATCHLFAFGKHYVGDAAGKVYLLDSTKYTNDGDALVRERTSPHEAVPGRTRQFFGSFYLDAETGGAPQAEDPMVELSWSDDSGKSWSTPLVRSLGKVGEVFPRLLWTRLGAARDRVWMIKCSANAPFSIVDAGADAKAGTN